MKDFWCVYFRKCVIVSNCEALKTKLRQTEGEIESEWGHQNKPSQYLAELLTKSSLPLLLFLVKVQIEANMSLSRKEHARSTVGWFWGKGSPFCYLKTGVSSLCFQTSGGLNIISWTPEKDILWLEERNDSGWKWQL